MSEALTIPRLMQQIPAEFRADKAQGVQAVVQLTFTGTQAGAYHLVISEGTCSVMEGKAKSPNMSITMDSDDFVALYQGEVQPAALFMQGRLKITGDAALAMKFSEIFFS